MHRPAMNTYSDFMRPWMLEAPESHLTDAHLAAFASAWTARDVDLLPEDVPRLAVLAVADTAGVSLTRLSASGHHVLRAAHAR